MISQSSVFWQRLEIFAAKENLRPLMDAYRDLCHYFENGAPLNKLFEYYQLISRITLEFKEFKENETRRMLSAHIKRLSQLGKHTEGQSRKLDGRIAKDKVENVLRDKSNLFLNYAEELCEDTQAGNIGAFQPNHRATNYQLYQIASLLCGIFSPLHEMKPHEVDYMSLINAQFNLRINKTNLPAIIKHKMNSFSTVLQHQATLYAMELSMDENDPDKQMWDIWGKGFIEAFKIRKEKFNPDLKPLPLKDNMLIWHTVKSLIDREFGGMDEANAEILLKHLDRVHRAVQSRYVFIEIYETIKKINNLDEREKFMQSFGHQMELLNPNNGKPHKLMKQWEFNDLEKVYDSMHRHLCDESLGLWEKKVFILISNLSVDLQMVLNDIFQKAAEEFIIPKLLVTNMETEAKDSVLDKVK
ncbi:uncharacterized protein PGTG_19008 [Puccinia graminis f. sp. tritici CRL 75-36-700-3]|uniref:Uncharacterized protein n=1 Tax=Puccinia graminis f. sp. tritici (strain CRL 75-36-700-3 / race SCCL) TaxID=418459 RepID=E3L8X0_PUCGT|nr:uncharacterized protein PGTG_19008 [Puccinia graminis f. sp. tritici CRL 75-36-700-3]EFP92995.1 hypothetical protein PGTG_19008 [Puccinia graminis f. sp. tritici CRL 75-36-700-3]